MTYQLLIADDHKMFLDGLSSILSQEDKINVLHTFKNGKDLFKYLTLNTEKGIDLVITDISMPDKNGLELNHDIKNQFPHIKTLVVSMHNDCERIKQLKKDKVDGYVLKNAEKEELLRAIYSILEGEQYFSEEVKQALKSGLQNEKNELQVRLSQREIDVISLIAQEFTTQEIADKLFLSKHTIESYRKNLMGKLQVKNLAGLTKYAIKKGIITV